QRGVEGDPRRLLERGLAEDQVVAVIQTGRLRDQERNDREKAGAELEVRAGCREHGEDDAEGREVGGDDGAPEAAVDLLQRLRVDLGRLDLDRRPRGRRASALETAP